MTHLIAPLAEPYTQADIVRFEALIYASSNPAWKIRLSGRAALARFVNKHGLTKCDMMMEALSKFHDDQNKKP
jgi:hypothetical protein